MPPIEAVVAQINDLQSGDKRQVAVSETDNALPFGKILGNELGQLFH